MNEVIRSMIERRSCRKFQDRQVDEAALQEILEAGTYAASGMGRQSPILVAVQDPEQVALLSKLNAAVMGSDKDPFYGAPMVVVVLADSSVRTCIEDGSLVIGNLMLAASTLGVASCWIHRAREVFRGEEGKALLKQWGLDEKYEGIGHCILGYRDGEKPEPPARKPGRILRV